jgi:hypothetical protein
MKSTLPTLKSDWSIGEENKINWEFWFFINNKTTGSDRAWVEMGYHDGYIVGLVTDP